MLSEAGDLLPSSGKSPSTGMPDTILGAVPIVPGSGSPIIASDNAESSRNPGCTAGAQGSRPR